MNSTKGFTLIEVMIVVVVIGILAAIAIPSYQDYVRKAKLADAKAEILKAATKLQQHKARSYNFKGFDVADAEFSVDTLKNFNIEIVDGEGENKKLTETDIGRTFAIRALPVDDVQQYGLLITSTNVQCMNKASRLIDFTECGEGKENW